VLAVEGSFATVRLSAEDIPLDAYDKVKTLLRQADQTDISSTLAWLRSSGCERVSPPTCERGR
jgi:hypothetical protein